MTSVRHDQPGPAPAEAVEPATDTLLQRPVALKVFHPNHSDPVVSIRQTREMPVVAGVDHPNLVTVTTLTPRLAPSWRPPVARPTW